MHRFRGMESKQPILVAVDGTEPSVRAARAGAQLACLRNCTLVLAFVERPQEVPADAGAAATFDQQGATGDHARKMLEEVRAQCDQHPPQVQLRVLQGNPAEAIANAASELDAWCIVVGTRHRGMLARVVLGSVSEDLIQLSDRPVLVVP